MREPVLVVMAAGMGRRYGGLKQVQPVGPNGQALLDYALYDALAAGFSQAVFVISPAMEKDFPREIKARLRGRLEVTCAVQSLDDLPGGFAVPAGREKPWGTGHAVRACRHVVSGPFAAINADDYYGPGGLKAIHDFLRRAGNAPGRYAMVGYELAKTLSENGHVARGICQTDENGLLLSIHERTHIISTQEGPLYTEDGQVYRKLENAVASMNLWGFSGTFMEELDRGFAAFLARTLGKNPLEGEYYLPEAVDSLVREGKARVEVLPCAERWYGVTYKRDVPLVSEAIGRMTAQGRYPDRLWG